MTVSTPSELSIFTRTSYSLYTHTVILHIGYTSVASSPHLLATEAVVSCELFHVDASQNSFADTRFFVSGR